MLGSMKILPESADSEYKAEMTKACEKLFKKLPKRQQEWIDKRISEICKDPSCGHGFSDPFLKGLFHTHARGSASNVLVIWSKQKDPIKKIIIEGVGRHKILNWLTKRRKGLRRR